MDSRDAFSVASWWASILGRCLNAPSRQCSIGLFMVWKGCTDKQEMRKLAVAPATKISLGIRLAAS